MKSEKKCVGTAIALFAVLGFAAPHHVLAEEKSEPVPGIDEDQTLSEQLDEDKGVIKPPDIGDTEIYVPAPDPDPGTTPVIPPPTADDPTVQPK